MCLATIDGRRSRGLAIELLWRGNWEGSGVGDRAKVATCMHATGDAHLVMMAWRSSNAPKGVAATTGWPWEG